MRLQRTSATKAGDIERKWYLIDAEEKVLGRLASRVAWLLMGKGKPYYSPNLDCGDHVVIVNAEKVRVTGKKLSQKLYYRHSGYIGGIKSESLEKRLENAPERVVADAVQGMVPKGRLGRQMITKLKVYRGPEHPHQAQKPEGVAL